MASRPFYETSDDLSREREVADEISRAWKCKVRKMPVSYRVDYALFSANTLLAWLEIKCRTNAMQAYDTYMISADKIMSGLDLAHHANAPFLLVVKWSDGIGYTKINKLSDYKIEFWGRADRGDPNDMEPVALIPIENFERIAVAA